MPKTKRIPLTQGRYAIVDAADYVWLSKFKWSHHQNEYHRFGYAMRRVHLGMVNGKQRMKRIWMHRLILGLGDKNFDPREADHINGNSLDNRRENLRICTRSQNSWNTCPRRHSSSRFKGVAWDTCHKKWRMDARKGGKRYAVEYYDSEIEAACAYNRWAKRLHGEFAWLNDV